MIYFIAFLLIVAGIFQYDYRRQTTTEPVALLLLWVILVGIAGLRYRLGNDSVIYEADYLNMPTLSDLSGFKFYKLRFEPGYVIFNSIPRSISSDFTLFQFFHAIVINTVIFWFIYNNTQNKFVALLFYYLGFYVNFNMEVLRESLAVCCFLLSWPFFRKNNWIIYYLIMLLGCTFHISAMITLFFPIFVAPGVRYLFKLGPQTFIVCLVFFVVGMVLQRKFFDIIELLSTNDSITQKAYLYSKNSLGGVKLNIFGMLEHLIKLIAFPLLALYYLKKSRKTLDDEFKKKWLQRIEIIVITGIYLSVITMAIPILSRFNNYIGLFNIVLMASCFFSNLRIRKKIYRIKASYWTVLILIVSSFYIKSYFVNTHGSNTHKVYMVYYPYETRLDPQENYDREVIFRRFKHLK